MSEEHTQTPGPSMLQFSLESSTYSTLHICITSRPGVDITTFLSPLPFNRVSLHDEVGQIKDIVDYIKSVVDTDRRTKRWGAEDKELVKCLRSLVGCETLMLRYTRCARSYLNSRFAGFSVSSSSSAAPFPRISGRLWKNYQIASMKHTSAFERHR
jgi:hypothetical protein